MKDANDALLFSHTHTQHTYANTPTHTHTQYKHFICLSVRSSELAAAVWKAIFSLRFQKVQINGVTCHLHKRRPHLRPHLIPAPSSLHSLCPPPHPTYPIKEKQQQCRRKQLKEQKEKRHEKSADNATRLGTLPFAATYDRLRIQLT